MDSFFKTLYDNFHAIHSEIIQALEELPPEALDWKPGPEMNSIGVIIVHLTGAERFLIGDIVMSEPSERDREAEFRTSGWNKEALLQRITTVEVYLQAALEKLSLSDLDTQRIHPRHGNPVTVSWALLHALEHTATHLGHIQMTVQLWQQKPG